MNAVQVKGIPKDTVEAVLDQFRTENTPKPPKKKPDAGFIAAVRERFAKENAAPESERQWFGMHGGGPIVGSLRLSRHGRKSHAARRAEHSGHDAALDRKKPKKEGKKR
jgi:hypothetical protein